MPCRLHGYPCFRFSVWAKTGEKQKDHRVLNTSCNSSLCCPTRSPLRMEAFSIECRKTRTKEIMTESQSKFQLSVESNPWLDWFCLTTVCDWSRKFAPISQPIKCKTKIDRDVVTRVSRATGSLRVCFVLIGRCDHSGFFFRVLRLSPLQNLFSDTYL